MKIIGVTGGTGAGKSTLSAELEKCGVEIIDADKISRQITKPGGAAFDEILDCFGKEVLTGNGELNRKRLAEIVFSNPDKRELLESITHKYVFEEMQRRLVACKAKIAVLDVPLLFQCNFPIKCDLTVAVIADKEMRIDRIMKRDGISRAEAEARIKNQLQNEEYRRLADVCFENSGDYEKLRTFAKNLCSEE